MNRHPINDDLDFTETIDALHRLHDAERQQPDAAFVQQLRQSLMSNAQSAAAPAGTNRPIDWAGGEARRWRPERTWPLGRFSTLATIAAVALLIASTTWFALRDGENSLDPLNTYTPVGAGNLETPTPTIPEEPVAGEWHVSPPASAAITADWAGGTDQLTVIDDIVVRAWSNQNASGLEALSATNGEVLWTNDIAWIRGPSNPAGFIYQPAFQSDGDNIYVVRALPQTAPGQILQYELAAIDVRTGEHRWAGDFDGAITSFGAGPTGLYVQRLTGDVLKVDPATGDIVWKYEGDPLTYGTIAPYLGPDSVIAIGNQGVVQSLDPQTGELIWKTETDVPPIHFSVAEGTLDSGQRVVVVRAPELLIEAYEGQRVNEAKTALIALDFETGDILWSQTLNNADKGQMQIANGTIYAVTSFVRYAITNDAGVEIDTGSRNWLVAIDLETGNEIWSVESDPPLYMAFDLTDDKLIMYRRLGRFVTVDPSERKITCDAYTPSDFTSEEDRLRPHAADYDGELLYLALGNGEVMAVDPGDWSC